MVSDCIDSDTFCLSGWDRRVIEWWFKMSTSPPTPTISSKKYIIDNLSKLVTCYSFHMPSQEPKCLFRHGYSLSTKTNYQRPTNSGLVGLSEPHTTFLLWYNRLSHSYICVHPINWTVKMNTNAIVEFCNHFPKSTNKSTQDSWFFFFHYWNFFLHY